MQPHKQTLVTPIHATQKLGDSLDAAYFRPPSTDENPVNKVTAFYPPTGFVGVFERNLQNEPWVRTQ